MNALLIKGIIAALLIAAALFAWNSYIGKVEERGYNRAAGEYATKLAKAKEEALETERDLKAKVKLAQDEGVNREKELRAIIESRTVVATGLRNTVANLRVSVSSATIDACRQSANAFAAVFEQCAERYASMAEAADRHANDVKTLTAAWPTVSSLAP